MMLATATKFARMNVVYYWRDTNIVQTKLARLFLRLAMWLDNVPYKE